MSQHQIVAYVQDDQIRVRYAPYLYKRFRELPAHRHYNKSEKNPENEFRFPATPEVAYLLYTTFIDVPRQWYTPEYLDLVDLGRHLVVRRFESTLPVKLCQPKLRTKDSWEHQELGYARLKAAGGTHALFMGPGCGKSKVIIDYLSNQPEIHKVLIVGPNRVIEVGEWHRQFERYWAGERDYEILSLVQKEHGSVKNRTKELKAFSPPASTLQVVLINYESMWREPMASALLLYGFDMAVFDESHRIKSSGSKQSNFAERLADVVQRRSILSGTHMPNNPLDIYGQFRFLDKTIFGTNFNKFKNEFAVYGGFENYQFLGMNPETEDEFNRRIQNVATIVDREDALDLPPAFHEFLEFELPKDAKKIYDEMEAEFYTYINGKEVDASNVLSQLIRLQQIAAGFVPIYDIVKNKRGEDVKKVAGWDRVHDAKRKFLQDLISDLPTKNPLVVFGLYREHLSDIKKATEELGLRYGEMSGTRNDYHDYMNDKVDVLGIQIVSGSEGLNELVRSNIAIYYATGYYNGKYRQSLARLHRPGQENRVLYYHIHAKDTIEPIIYETLEGKESVIKRYMPKEEPTHQNSSSLELLGQPQ